MFELEIEDIELKRLINQEVDVFFMKNGKIYVKHDNGFGRIKDLNDLKTGRIEDIKKVLIEKKRNLLNTKKKRII